VRLNPGDNNIRTYLVPAFVRVQMRQIPLVALI
jgi:hypothetical protein